MLEEKPIKADKSGRKRASFRGDWIDAQLTYGKRGVVDEVFITYLAPYRAIFALLWTKEKGYAHHRIGYTSGGSDIITCPDAQYLSDLAPNLFDRDELRARIFVGGARLDKKIREFLLKTIDGYPTELARCPYCKEKRPADCECHCGKRACIPCVRKDAFLAKPCSSTQTLHGWQHVPGS
ncbi:MAG: hypothetical protein HY925_00280 [Elusimicrobia bacterium]|nr:hypothetical protein [Elusimicrobiota bacterium]